MVVLFCSIGKNEYNYNTREFADYVKGIIGVANQTKITGFEVYSLKLV